MRRALPLALLLIGRAVSAAGEGGVAIVASAQAPPNALTAAELGPIFLKQRQFAAGLKLQPVNLPPAHPLRRWLGQQVLHQSSEELEGYWRNQYFNGVTPPYVLESEEAVIRFVAATPGAIGYVSSCAVDKRVRVLLQFEGGPGCTR